MQAGQFFQAVNAQMRAWGYNVAEQEGCWSRSNGSSWANGGPIAHTNHHFVIPLSDAISDGVNNVTYGDSTLSGPKCNYYIGVDPRNGRPSITFIAAGTANHPGQGRSEVFDRVSRDIAPLGWVAEKYSPVADNWGSATRYYCGTEMHHPGDSTPWPPVLIQLAVDLNAAMCLVGGWSANRCHMHAEHSARKIDMSYLRGQGGFDLRARIAARMGNSGTSTPQVEKDWFDMASLEDLKTAVRAELSAAGVSDANAETHFMYQGEAFMNEKNERIYPFTRTATIFNDVRGTGSRLNVVVDDSTGAWYAVGPGVFWHIPSFDWLNAGRKAGLFAEGEHHMGNAEVILVRESALADNGEVYIAPATYTVAAGDTLSKIAASLGVTVDALAQANGINDVNNIAVGQVLTIPKA